jgi:hypothetical protein
MFNFVSLGAVGGDVFKAFLITHERPQRRMEAVLSIMADRIIGMYALLILTSAAILFVEMPSPSTPIQVISRSTLLITAAVTAVLLLLLLQGSRWAKFVDRLARIRRIGPLIQRTAAAIGMYRDRPRMLVAASVISVAVQALIAVSLFLAATGLYATAPKLSEHFIISPMANVVGALPIAPSGLGTFEAAMRYLYDHVPAGGTGIGKGLVVALCYRVMTIIVALVGVGFYWTDHREVKEVLHEVEEAQRGQPEQVSQSSRHTPVCLLLCVASESQRPSLTDSGDPRVAKPATPSNRDRWQPTTDCCFESALSPAR